MYADTERKNRNPTRIRTRVTRRKDEYATYSAMRAPSHYNKDVQYLHPYVNDLY